jgi:hypothetical protein
LPAGKRVDVQVFDRPDAFAVRELQQASSAIADDIAVSTRTSSAMGAGPISAVHSPGQRPHDDQLTRSGELPAERALGWCLTSVQADQHSAAPHYAQLAHRVGVELDQTLNVAF